MTPDGGNGHDSAPDHEDLQAATAYLEAGSVGEAAERIGVSERTMYRRLERPGVQALIREARAAIYGQAVARLTAASGEAADVVLSVVRSESARVPDRLRAAGMILDRAGRDFGGGDPGRSSPADAREEAVRSGDKAAYLNAGGTDYDWTIARLARGLEV